MHIVEGAVACRIVGDRAGEQLVPTGKLCGAALNVNRVGGADAQVGAVVGLGHQVCTFFVQELRNLLGFQPACKLVVQQHQTIAQFVVTAFSRLQDQAAALLQLQTDGHPGLMFLAQFVTEAGEGIDPGFDAIFVKALLCNGKRAFPAIVADIGHDHAVPAFILQRAPADQYGELVMAVGEHLAGNGYPLPNHSFYGEFAAVDYRGGAFDSDPGQQQRLGQRQW